MKNKKNICVNCKEKLPKGEYYYVDNIGILCSECFYGKKYISLKKWLTNPLD